jgi:amyloid beta A4 protein
LEEEDEEDEYDSDEEASDFINDNGNNYNYNNWDLIINTSQIIINKDASTTNSPTTVSTTTITTSSATTSTSAAAASASSQTTAQITDKPSEIPISPMSDGATAIPTPDPYFTHFDPRTEHQSYKVGLDVKTTLKITNF